MINTPLKFLTIYIIAIIATASATKTLENIYGLVIASRQAKTPPILPSAFCSLPSAGLPHLLRSLLA